MSASYKLKRLALVLAISSAGVVGLNGCVAAVVGATAAGAGAVIGSDSRTVDIQIDDQAIENEALRYLSNDRMRSDSKVFRVDCVSVNGNVLLVGQTNDTEYLMWCISHIRKIKNVKRIYNHVEQKAPVSATTIMKDSYITSKVKGALLVGSKISSGRFKVYTEDSVVFLLGYVTRDEGARAINQARKIDGIKKVVPIFDYMDQSGTPNSSDGAPVVNGSSKTAVGGSTNSSSSVALENQSEVDNGGAVLEEDSDLLAPSTPAQGL